MFEHQCWSCKKENNNKELERSALTSRDHQTSFLSTHTQLVDALWQSHDSEVSKGKRRGAKIPFNGHEQYILILWEDSAAKVVSTSTG